MTRVGSQRNNKKKLRAQLDIMKEPDHDPTGSKHVANLIIINK